MRPRRGAPVNYVICHTCGGWHWNVAQAIAYYHERKEKKP